MNKKHQVVTYKNFIMRRQYEQELDSIYQELKKFEKSGNKRIIKNLLYFIKLRNSRIKT